MTLDEIVSALSDLHAQRVFRTLVAQLDEASIKYAIVGDFPVISARLEIAVERASRENAIATIESAGFTTVACHADESRHLRGIAEVHMYYVDDEMLAREHDLAWCSFLTKDEPPSREITPPDAEPFTL
ncbi:MAG TPA: hypothetical protein VJ901_05555 [Thermoanaerobaculia bacterium]|nr:hypothetical protein [Thermoanaerobaculia bacterium]